MSKATKECRFSSSYPARIAVAEGVANLDAAKAIRELGAEFHGEELTFRFRKVVRNIGATVGFGYTRIGQRNGDGLGGHGATTVGVDR